MSPKLSQGTELYLLLLEELSLGVSVDVVPEDVDELVAIRARLLVPETQRVRHLVRYHSQLKKSASVRM